MRSFCFASAVLLVSSGLACSAGGTKTDGPTDLADVSTGDSTTDGPVGGDGFDLDGDGNWDVAAPCVGLKCKRVPCADGTKTSLSGTVYDPSGKLPLYNVVVYIPNEDPLPLPKGVSCDKCGALVSGAPIVTALTDAKGHFTLTDVPVDDNVPLIIQVGKWRRKFTVPTITACTANSAPKLLLPKKQSEGDMPKIAIATGGADALECLFPRIGIDPTEFGGQGSKAAFHLYNGSGGKTTTGTVDASGFWGDLTKLKTYDMVLLSCEGSEFPSNKSSALTAMHDYASDGGRIFASHYHYYWFNNGPSDFQSVATWSPGAIGGASEGDYTVDQTFPKGKSFADWLVNVGASTTKGTIHLKDIRNDVSAVNAKTSQKWIYQDTPKYFTFNTPVTKPAEAQCGRVVFTDLHVGSGNTPGGTFPGGCLDASVALTPQEKALAFLIFDLGSCVQKDGDVPIAPPPK
jgi:hypothetical protein